MSERRRESALRDPDWRRVMCLASTTSPVSSRATQRPRKRSTIQPSLPEQPALSGLAPRGDCPLGSGVFVRCEHDASRWMRRAHVGRWCRDCRCNSGSTTTGATDRRPSGHIPMRDVDQRGRSTPARNSVLSSASVCREALSAERKGPLTCCLLGAGQDLNLRPSGYERDDGDVRQLPRRPRGTPDLRR
jgi:hypothetical protein